MLEEVYIATQEEEEEEEEEEKGVNVDIDAIDFLCDDEKIDQEPNFVVED